MAKPKRTGSWYKVRAWSERNLTWNQIRGLHETPEAASKVARIMAEETGFRVQAIHLRKVSKGATVDVIFDSRPESTKKDG